MGRPERPVDASGGAVADFASRLRRLRAEAGNPTYRDMARTAMYSASVLSSAANGHRLPTLQVALAYAAACGGEREEWRGRWLSAATRGGVPVIGNRPAAPPEAAGEPATRRDGGTGPAGAAPARAGGPDPDAHPARPGAGHPGAGPQAGGAERPGADGPPAVRTEQAQQFGRPDGTAGPVGTAGADEWAARRGPDDGYLTGGLGGAPHGAWPEPAGQPGVAEAYGAANQRPSAPAPAPNLATASAAGEVGGGLVAPGLPSDRGGHSGAVLGPPSPGPLGGAPHGAWPESAGRPGAAEASGAEGHLASAAVTAPAAELGDGPAANGLPATGSGYPGAAVRPSSAGHPVPRQLPLRPQGLIGRRAELCRLGGPGGSPVVISGPVGVGKSELALRHAHDLAPGMVDGQLYADLGPLTEVRYDLGGLLCAFLTALGVEPERIPATPDQRAALYRSLLARRRLLVLLENVHCERQVRPLLADSETSTTLVVSRTSLLGLRDVRRLRLDPLARDESAALITAVLPERAGADPAAVDRLAALCGDLPLALDIATRKLLARPEVPLRWAVARLVEPSALLDWLCVGDLSMREAINSAHVQLGEAAAGLIDRLAVLPERELWAEDPVLAGAEEAVDELVEAGMLRPGERHGGYRLDPLVRAFVRDRDPARNLLPRRALPFPQIRPEPAAPGQAAPQSAAPGSAASAPAAPEAAVASGPGTTA
ncbi:hypothetical protein ACIRBX_03360 [Kitasatospora sp. NPDC096147]|uniref:hypothetical protein n=1 Tax=Kitasatospora sp. NPDC096147 TaxID=3364093 RepID=UPI0037FF8972